MKAAPARALACLGLWLASACHGGSDPGQLPWPSQGRWLTVWPSGNGATPAFVTRTQTTTVAWTHVPDLRQALLGDDASRLVERLQAHRFDGLWWFPSPPQSPPNDASLLARLSRREALAGLPEAWLSRQHALLKLQPTHPWSAEAGAALADCVCALLTHQHPSHAWPTLQGGADALEVMVMLRLRGKALVWRSARDTGLAEATTVAAHAVATRWRERQAATLGELAQQAPKLQLVVARLQRDGVLLDASDAFLQQAVTPQHGIGIERRHRWHYLLPEAAHAGGSVGRALTLLLAQHGLPPSARKQKDVRLYRFVVQTLTSTDLCRQGPTKVL